MTERTARRSKICGRYLFALDFHDPLYASTFTPDGIPDYGEGDGQWFFTKRKIYNEGSARWQYEGHRNPAW